MALDDAPRGLSGAVAVGRTVVAADGVKGLYRGLGTVVAGVIPARGVYLTTLEAVKAGAERALHATPAPWQRSDDDDAAAAAPPLTTAAWLGDARTAAAANLAGGAVASLFTQGLTVPIDVVSQRLMVEGGGGSSGRSGPVAAAPPASPPGRAPPPPARSGLAMARSIIAAEGVRGLYRGFGASVLTFVPSSAVWWAAYGGYQRALWQQLHAWHGRGGGGGGRGGGAGGAGGASAAPPPQPSPTTILAVQTAAALAAGITSATLTTPLDVVKTRLQVAGGAAAAAAAAAGPSSSGSPTPVPPRFGWAGVVRSLVAEEGLPGLWRGLAPRILSVALWGTVMVNSYEALKRLAALPPPDRPGGD
jgi:solute carrier family 25 protein 44